MIYFTIGKAHPIVACHQDSVPVASLPLEIGRGEMKAYGFGSPAPISSLSRFAAALMARYRIDELKSGDVSLLIGLLGKIGFSPKGRGALNLQTKST